MIRYLISSLLLALPILALSSSLNVGSLDPAWLSNLKYMLRGYQDLNQRCYEYATRINLKIHEGSTITPQAEYADNNILLKLSSVLAARKVPKGPNGLVEYTNYCINVLEGYDGSNYKVVKLNVDPQLYGVDLSNVAIEPVEVEPPPKVINIPVYDLSSHVQDNTDGDFIAQIKEELEAVRDELASYKQQSNDKDKRIEELESALESANNKDIKDLMSATECSAELVRLEQQLMNQHRKDLELSNADESQKNACVDQLNKLLDEKKEDTDKLKTCTVERDSFKAQLDTNQLADKLSGNCENRVQTLGEEIRRALQRNEEVQRERQECQDRIEKDKPFLNKCQEVTNQVHRYMVADTWSVRCMKWDVFRK